MLILTDCDGVLADFVKAFLSGVLGATGRWYKHENVTDWDFTKTLGTAEELAPVWERFKLPHIVEHLADVQGAPWGIRELRRAHRVVCVTSPLAQGAWLTGRVQWLQDRGMAKEDIVLAWDKGLVPGDALIEDNAEHLRRWLDFNPEGFGYLLDQPWNRSARPHPRMIRCADWPEIVSCLIGGAHRQDCWGYPGCYGGCK